MKLSLQDVLIKMESTLHNSIAIPKLITTEELLEHQINGKEAVQRNGAASGRSIAGTALAQMLARSLLKDITPNLNLSRDALGHSGCLLMKIKNSSTNCWEALACLINVHLNLTK